MKDAIGGSLSLQMILIFLVIVNSYLAFSVNYTKAFRVKNEIRSIIEKHEGLTCEAANDIDQLLLRTNYESPGRLEAWCNEMAKTQSDVKDNKYGSWKFYKSDKSGFCYKITPINQYGTVDEDEEFKGAYFTVATYVNVIKLPLINNMLSFMDDLFVVKGETALIYSSGINYDGLTQRCESSSSGG